MCNHGPHRASRLPCPQPPQTVTFYDSRGEFAGVRRLGSGKPIEVEGLRLTADAVLAATGLELKSDPGVPLVYAGFGGEWQGQQRAGWGLTWGVRGER